MMQSNGRYNGQSNGRAKPPSVERPPLDAGDLAKMLPSASEWLIKNLIPAQRATLLYGEAGIGKSYLALAIARACITGEPFAGYLVHKCGKVLYIDHDMDIEEQTRRWWALGRGAGYTHPPDGLYCVQLRTDLFTVWGDILRLVNELQPVLVIVDSYGMASGKPLDTEVEYKLFRLLESLGCAVLVIDILPRHAFNRFRLEMVGRKRNWVGLMLHHEESITGITQPNIPMVFEFQKWKHKEYLRLHTGDSAKPYCLRILDAECFVLWHLRDEGEATVEMIAETIEWDTQKVLDRLQTLEWAGLVEKVPHTSPPRYRALL